MRLGFLVSDVISERPVYTTITVALAALRRGHDVVFIEPHDFTRESDGAVRVRARSAPLPRSVDDVARSYLGALAGDDASVAEMDIDELDLLWLRSEPSFDATTRPEVQTAGFVFGQLVQEKGVAVLSNPTSLQRAFADKMYSLRFPLSLRPATIVTCDPERIRSFVDAHGEAVVKPLQGGAGTAVFLVRAGDPNLNQIIETVSARGYMVAQEYLPEAIEGTLRLFMMNGRPLQVEGKYACMRHLPAGGDPRSNFRVSGATAPGRVDAKALSVAEAIGPRLAADDMFLVGVDIVGDKMLEVNVFSPGGLTGAERLQAVDFSSAVVGAMEERVRDESRSSNDATIQRR